MTTITLKAGPGYDAPWFVSEADTAEQHKVNIMGFLGVTPETNDEHGNKFGELTPLDLTCIAAELFQGRFALIEQPSGGGRFRKGGGGGGGSKPQTQARPAEAAPAPSSAGFLEAIEGHTDKGELQKFFVKNRSEMEGDAEVMQALKAKFATFN